MATKRKPYRPVVCKQNPQEELHIDEVGNRLVLMVRTTDPAASLNLGVAISPSQVIAVRNELNRWLRKVTR